MDSRLILFVKMESQLTKLEGLVKFSFSCLPACRLTGTQKNRTGDPVPTVKQFLFLIQSKNLK